MLENWENFLYILYNIVLTEELIIESNKKEKFPKKYLLKVGITNSFFSEYFQNKFGAV